MVDLEQIEIILAKLQSNYSELARNWFNIFYNPTPMDVTIKFYDEEGTLQTYRVPNRAKDFTLYINGKSNPEGGVIAGPSTIYQNTENGEAFIKATGTGSSGWVKLVSEADLDGFIIKGSGAPTGNVTAKLGTLYVDVTRGVLYVKTTPTSNVGWQALIDVTASYFVHFIPTGRTVVVKVPSEVASSL